MKDWDIQKARRTYNIDYWSDGYFDINEQGHVIACPDRDAGSENISEGISEGIDLYALSREFNDAGLSLPVLVRFTDILHDRVDTLCSAFRNA
ncbi:MAG: arginine decarboxylase, partial [Gammaproteobacteria bacterium]|nr:arginine decarboxylase [Gammaproteobacteria bacterium]